VCVSAQPLISLWTSLHISLGSEGNALYPVHLVCLLQFLALLLLVGCRLGTWPVTGSVPRIPKSPLLWVLEKFADKTKSISIYIYLVILCHYGNVVAACCP